MSHYLQPTMRGTFCFLIMLIGLPAVKAQSWCPSGAEWIMKPDLGLPINGNSRVYYAGDTVLGGITGQRLGAETFFVNWGDTVIQHSEVATGMVTSSTADVVSVWSIDSLTWDTLFWFSALPGDRWQEPHLHILPGASSQWIEVQDTATVVIDGVPLRQLTVAQVCDSIWIDWGGQITERLGYWTPFTFPPTCGTQSGLWELTCYNDSSISYSTGDGCDFLLSVAEPFVGSIVIFPNPGNDHFTLDLPQSAHVVEVLDATGRRALSERSTTGTVRMNTESLAKGIYLVRVDGTRTARWVKQ